MTNADIEYFDANGYVIVPEAVPRENLQAVIAAVWEFPEMDPEEAAERFPHYEDPGFIHWDLDTSQPLPERLGVQGVLALTDTTAEMGGFHCIPGFHRALADWIAEQPGDRNPR